MCLCFWGPMLSYPNAALGTQMFCQQKMPYNQEMYSRKTFQVRITDISKEILPSQSFWLSFNDKSPGRCRSHSSGAIWFLYCLVYTHAKVSQKCQGASGLSDEGRTLGCGRTCLQRSLWEGRWSRGGLSRFSVGIAGAFPQENNQPPKWICKGA